MCTRFIALLIAAPALLAASDAGAQQTAESPSRIESQSASGTAAEPPIIIDSERNEYDMRSGVTRFHENVTIQRGAMNVSADYGEVHQSEGEITTIELEGNPTTWRDRLDDGTLVEGEARRIHFDVAENVVTLTGQAQIRHAQGQFTGDELVYDLDTESLAGRGTEGSRARVVLEPETLEDEQAPGNGNGSAGASESGNGPDNGQATSEEDDGNDAGTGSTDRR